MRDRQVVMTITADGLTSDELGRLQREIRKINYRRRKNHDLELRFNFRKKGEAYDKS